MISQSDFFILACPEMRMGNGSSEQRTLTVYSVLRNIYDYGGVARKQNRCVVEHYLLFSNIWTVMWYRSSRQASEDPSSAWEAF
jgi:hypothetical protein